MNKETQLTIGIAIPVVIGATTILGMVFGFITGTTPSQSNPQILEVVSDGFVAPIGGMIMYYTFSVPEEAVNPRLIGQYEVLSGLDMDVTVLDQDGCDPVNPQNCISVYSASNRDRGEVDVAATPGKTYYLEFHNPGFLLVRGQLK